MKTFLCVLLLALAAGCTNYTALCQGDKPGQYYAIRRQSFIFFSNLNIVELNKSMTGVNEGKMCLVRKVYPSDMEEEPEPVKKATEQPSGW